jgi:AraC-like DNA-binding protein
MMVSVAMTRGTILGPVYASMERVNLSVSKMAPRRGLPSCDITDPRQWVPTHAVCSLIEDVQNQLPPEDGATWVSAIADPAALGPIFDQLGRASTIGMLLKEYRRFYHQVRNYAELTLTRRGNDIVIRRWVNDARTRRSEMLEVYALLEFVRVIQRLSGIAWTPAALEVQQGSSEQLRRLPEFANAEVRVGAPATGMAVPIRLLGLPIPDSNRIASNGSPDAEAATGTVPLALCDCIYALLCSRFVDGCPDMESVAECLGISARSLRRQLAKEGLTYRQLIDHYRFETARRLIETTDRSLIDIACQLGYTEAASFTRAFRRWAGLSPSEYRAARALQPNTVA